jgi:hypothetical protein
LAKQLLFERRILEGGFMSVEFCSAVKGSGVGTVIGTLFGIATLATIGFARVTLFEGVLLASCAAFGGILFGGLIGITGAFRRKPVPEATTLAPALRAARVA